jgi:adenylate cyclase
VKGIRDLPAIKGFPIIQGFPPGRIDCTTVTANAATGFDPRVKTAALMSLLRSGAGISRSHRRLLRALLVAAVSSAAVFTLAETPLFRRGEALVYDARARLAAGLATPDSAIAIVAIDDNSLEVYADVLGRWPWPRDVHAALVQYLHAAGARLVVFDVLFPEPDAARPDADAHFAEVLDASELVVLPLTFTPGSETAAAEWETARGGTAAKARAALRRHAVGPAPTSPGEVAPDERTAASPDMLFAYSEPPVAAFAAGARALGAITMAADADGVVRRERLVFAYQDQLYPSLALAAARAAAPERFAGAVTYSAGEIRSGAERIPLDRGRFPVRWRGRYLAGGRTTYPAYPAFHVLNSLEQVATGVEPTIPFEAFRGKVVFVGVTAVGLHEARATPLAPHDPGVIIHATILDNLLRGDYLRRAPAGVQWSAVVVVALAVALPVALLPSVVWGAAAALLVLLLAAVAASIAFASGIWVDLAAPLGGGGLALAGALGAGYLAEGRDKRRVRELFGRYVSPAYVDRLAEYPGTLRLGGERVPLTVLFSDIRGFTSMSEQLPAEVVIRLLNEYLEAMAEVVFRHEGTIDKFIGDAVMAFWGAPVPVPDHARRAAETALDMCAELRTLNDRWAAAGIEQRLAIGVGIHTGEAIVGNIGSLTRKLDYTAIGDTVNLASRLEGLNKEYDTTILVSAATAAAAGGGYDMHDLGEVRVKGKEHGVGIYELRGRVPPSPAPDREPHRGAPAASARANRGGAAAPLLALLLAAGLLAAPEPVMAQQAGAPRAQWTARLYQPGVWRGNRIERIATRDAATTELALTAVVELYSARPRWRAEIRRVTPGGKLEEPVVLVANGSDVRVLTAVGSTPLADHAMAADPLTAGVLALFDRNGAPADPARTRLVELRGNGEVQWVTLRRAAARPDVPDRLFATGGAGVLGRRIARLGIHAVGGERDQEVVASAGARGVARVRTVDGEITVNPDTLAVQRMVARELRAIDLDAFMRAAGLGPYARSAMEQRQEEER